MNGYFNDAARYVAASGLFTALLLTPAFRPFALSNVAVQVVLFLVIAAIPAYRTGRMSYVDIAWPWGLVAIGLQTLALGDGYPPRTVVVASIYLLVGLRMGVPGLLFLLRHGALPIEFPRYRYQRLRWQAAGHRGEKIPMQLEIFLQAAANATVLAVPAMLLAFNSQASLSVLEILGFALWAGAWAMEWLADNQKRRFVADAAARADGRSTCDVGLWRYSRHPNYFFQWMGWNALVLAAAPSLITLYRDGRPVVWTLTAVALVAASGFMYWTLVEFTGIKPSEYYSARKRRAYVEYQQTTNMFVPGPRHRAAVPVVSQR